ncbi:NADPH-dependent FMN reductase [uncultured archaeon]|nr:NADPH-dependent FMN reductase [uncultured archaeon]
MYIPVILGTAREGRQSENAAKFIHAEAAKFGFQTELIDVRDYRIPATDNTQQSPTAKKLEEKISRADGFIIVSPEYNHGYPGELKMMLDLLYQQYAYKPLGICGVSGGPIGGARMAEQLREVAVELHMVPIREAVYFPLVQNLFDEKGNIKDKAYYERIKPFFSELEWYARALKVARESTKR